MASITIDGTVIPFKCRVGLQTAAGNPAMYRDAIAGSLNANNDGIREKLALIARFVSDFAASNSTFPWTVNVWGYRLNFFRVVTERTDATGAAPTFVTWAVAGAVTTMCATTRSVLGTGAYQTGGTAGSDGNPPKASDYKRRILDRRSRG